MGDSGNEIKESGSIHPRLRGTIRRNIRNARRYPSFLAGPSDIFEPIQDGLAGVARVPFSSFFPFALPFSFQTLPSLSLRLIFQSPRFVSSYSSLSLSVSVRSPSSFFPSLLVFAADSSFSSVPLFPLISSLLFALAFYFP